MTATRPARAHSATRARRQPPRRGCLHSPPRRRTTTPMASRRLESESFGGGRYGIHKIGSGGKLLAIRLPTFGMHARLLLEAFPLEQVEPSIRSRVDEQLEIRIERELVVGRIDRQLHPAVPREQNLE